LEGHNAYRGLNGALMPNYLTIKNKTTRLWFLPYIDEFMSELRV